MQSRYYWKLLLRYLSNECTEKEKKDIEEKIKTDEIFAEFMNQILSLKQKPLQLKDVDTKWNEIKADILERSPGILREKEQKQFPKYSFMKKSTPGYWKILRYAAVLVLLFGLSYYFIEGSMNLTGRRTTEEYRVLTVNHGERLTITLSDGSTVTLDAGSEFRYPAKFTNRRDVYLSGEAYFQVAHDPQKPFYVHVNHALVHSIGTRFNIRAWGENSAVTVTVLQGKVSLSRDDPNAIVKVFLRSNEQGALYKNGLFSKPIKVNANDYIQWMHNEIHFNNVSLRIVLAQLERWYDFKFVVPDTLLLKHRITVHIRRSNVDEVIKLISIITNTKIVREGKKIQILSKKR